MTQALEIIEPQEVPPAPAPASAPVPAPASETATILQIVERAARDPSVDIDRLERLMGMAERARAFEAEKRFNAAMRAAQAEMPQVVRDADNDHTKSKYARLETISAAMQPVITGHGFSISFDTADSPHPNHYRIMALVSHDDGHSRNYHADIPIDGTGAKGTVNKTATHAFGSTMSYGRRYLKLLIFDVATKGEDDDGKAAGDPGPITEEQAAELRALADEVGVDVRRFCAFLRVGSLAEIPASKFDEARRALEAKRRRA